MIKSLLPSLSAVLLDVLCAGYCPHALTVFFQIYLQYTGGEPPCRVNYWYCVGVLFTTTTP